MQHYTEDRVARNAGGHDGSTPSAQLLRHRGRTCLSPSASHCCVGFCLSGLSQSQAKQCLYFLVSMCTGAVSSSSLGFNVLTFYLAPYLCVVHAGWNYNSFVFIYSFWLIKSDLSEILTKCHCGLLVLLFIGPKRFSCNSCNNSV